MIYHHLIWNDDPKAQYYPCPIIQHGLVKRVLDHTRAAYARRGGRLPSINRERSFRNSNCNISFGGMAFEVWPVERRWRDIAGIASVEVGHHAALIQALMRNIVHSDKSGRAFTKGAKERFQKLKKMGLIAYNRKRQGWGLTETTWNLLEV